MSKAPFISRVRLRNYKSIARCDVQLGSLAILVGPNGSGKSNFLDALALTRQALDVTLDHAFRERGGINEVRRRFWWTPLQFFDRPEFHTSRRHQSRSLQFRGDLEAEWRVFRAQ